MRSKINVLSDPSSSQERNSISGSANENFNITNNLNDFSGKDMYSDNLKNHDMKRRVDDEISHFSRGLDWKPKSKGANISEISNKERDNYPLTIKSNLDLMFKKEKNDNPFMKNLNHTNTFNTTSSFNSTMMNTSSSKSSGVSIEEIRNIGNKLRFLSDNAIKSLDNMTISEIKSLSIVCKNLLEKID